MSCCSRGIKFQFCKMNEFQRSAVPLVNNTALYTEKFNRVVLFSSGLEVRMVRCGEGRNCLSSLTSFQGFIFISFTSHRNFGK